MGIKRLMSFIRDNCKHCIITDYITILSDNRKFGKIAIDTSVLLFHHKYGAVNSTIKNTTFVFSDRWNYLDEEVMRDKMMYLLERFINTLRHYNVEPIFVLDGKPPIEKKDTQHERLETYKKTKKNLREKRKIENLEEYKRVLRCCSHPTPDDKEAYINKIKDMDCTLLKGECEGEKLCHHLAKKDFVQAIFSTDTDLFAYGDNIMIESIDLSFGSVPTITYVDSEELEKTLGLTREQMLDYCIMCGTDYNKNIKNFSTKRCLDIIKKYKNLETVVKNVDEFRDFEYQHIRDLFLSEVDVKKIDKLHISSRFEDE